MKLPFSNYDYGAGIATDLVNTSPEVRSVGEILPDPPALARFLAKHHARLDALQPDGMPTDDDLEHVHALREEIRSILESDTEDDAATGANALVIRAATGPTLHRDTDHRWRWSVMTAPGASLADELGVLAGVGLLWVLHTLSHERFRHCASPTCHGMFVDTSRAGRRRYCMPEICGNRVNVANYRARKQATSGPSPSMP